MKKMIYLFYLFFTIFIVFYKSAYAGSNVQFLNGAKLLEICKDPKAVNQSACEGYILGVQDAINSGHLSKRLNLCFPKGVSPKDLRLNLINFIEVMPQTAKFSGESVVAKSLELHYKCKS
jgi:hypothetical protein